MGQQLHHRGPQFLALLRHRLPTTAVPPEAACPAASGHGRVNTHGPFAVSATQCSKWAE
jgi:hypothetical protein